MTSLFVLVAVLPAFIKANFIVEQKCNFDILATEELSCKPSHVQCIGQNKFTLCINTVGLTVMPKNIYSCPPKYECHDEKENVACVLKLGEEGPPTLPLPPDILVIIPVFQNIIQNPPELPPSANWPKEDTRVPPHVLEDVRTIYEVKSGRNVTISCGLAGTPTPKITWKKEGAPLNMLHDDGRFIVNDDQTLTIINVRNNDDGIYECSGVNGVGGPETSAENFIRLTVVQIKEAPPIIGRESETVIIPCDDYIGPDAKVMWIKNGAAIVENDKQKINKDHSLELYNPTKDDAGNYYCSVVENGRVRTVTVTVIIGSQNDPIRPKRLSIDTKIVGCLHGVVTLQCPITGNPSPTILWLKDSLPIDNDNPKYAINQDQTLTINRLDQFDSNTYYCSGDNGIGKPLTAEIQLTSELCIPPYTSDTFTDEVVVIIAETARLNCSVVGVPTPKVTWTKDGKEIDNKYDTRYILNADQTLNIREAKKSDEGVYVCLASNNISTPIINTLTLIVVDPYEPSPPTITWAFFISNVTVGVGEPLLLSCPATGFPPPVIMWSKENQEISTDLNYIVNSNQTLTIVSAQLKDAGVWTCLAINNVGSGARGNINVNVDPRKPPRKDDNVYTDKVHAVENSLVIIPCGVTGVPTPHITWLKDGQLIQFGFSPRYKLNEGQHLVISNITRSDVGVYSCTAVNELGSITQNIETFVYATDEKRPPLTNYMIFDPTSRGVTGGPLTINCSVEGNPPPTITWFKNGIKIDTSTQNVIINHNQTLTISHLSEYEAGAYECMGENGIGDPVVNKIQIITTPRESMQPPTVVVNELVTRLQGHLGGVLILVCPVTGNPKPKIVWIRGGVRVSSNNPRYLIYANQTLKIKPLLDEDSTVWSCVAVNGVNNPISIHINVTVVHDNVIRPVVEYPGHDIVISCPIKADKIVWLKDNKIITPPGLQNIEITNNSLIIHDAQVSDTEFYYTCAEDINSERPEVGSIKPDVFKRPKRDPAFNYSINAEVHRPIILSCAVTGSPRPVIAWRRHGKEIKNSKHRFVVTRDQSLMITDVLEVDAGEYECIANNNVGDPLVSKVEVSVYAPLKVDRRNYEKVVIATVGETKVINCAIVGTPHPKTTWSKANVPVGTNDPHFVINQETKTLTILDAALKDSGLYHCLAENGISKERTDIILTVRDKSIAPTKDPGVNPNVEVTKGEPAFLTCPVIANPPPEIKWVRDAKLIHNTDPNYVVHNNGTLEIKNTSKSNEGSYACIADNEVGSPIAIKILLTVNVPQAHHSTFYISVGPESKVILKCDLLSSPDAVWTKNDQSINNNSPDFHIEEDKSLIIEHAKYSDEGRYVCNSNNNLVVNEYVVTVGQKKTPAHSTIETVLENVDLTLNCNFPDQSPSTVTWIRRNEILRENSTKYRINSNNMLVIINAQKTDEGMYLCVNDKDKVSNDYRVIVERDKYKRTTSSVTLVPAPIARTVILQCKATMQDEELYWTKDGVAIGNEDPRIHYKPGQLIIENLQPSDKGQYSCNGERESNEYLVVPMEVKIVPGVPKTDIIIAVPAAPDSTLLLSCPIQGDIIWSKAGRPINRGDLKHQLLPNGDLKVFNVDKGDTGKYTCQDRNNNSTEAQYIVSMDKTDVPSPNPPKVVVTPPPIPAGGNILLDCGISGPITGPVTWYKDNVEVDLRSNKYYLGPNQTLEVKALEGSDSGSYTCKRKNADNTTSVNIMNVVVETDSYFKPGTAIIQPLLKHSSVQLSCSAQPGDIVTWYKDNLPVVPTSDSRSRINPDQTLYIDALEKKDEASYSCIIQKLFGDSNTKNVFVIVIYEDKHQPTPDQAPKTRPAPVNNVLLPPLTPGTTVTLNCGIEPLNGMIDWLKENQVLSNDGKHRINPDKTLDILDGDDSDSGTYYCRGRTKDGVDTVNSFIIRIDPQNPFPAGHIIVIYAHYGDTTYLHCSSETPPPISWSKNNVQVEPNNPGMNINAQGVLQIDSIKASDAGVFVCTGDGGALRNIFMLIVPRASTIMPQQAIGRVLEVPTFTGTTVSLKCSVRGHDGKIDWIKDGVQVQNYQSDLQVLPDQSLQIRHVKKSDAGKYTCLIFHPAGPLSDTFLLTVTEKVFARPPLVSSMIPVNVNSDLNLICTIPGLVPYSENVIWTKQNTEINSRGSHIFVKQDQTLQMNNIQKPDEGTYICSVRTPNGIVSSAYIVTVRDNPNELFPSGTVIRPFPLNSPATLECLLPEVGIESVIWKKDGLMINHNDVNYRVNGKTLDIVNLRLDLLGIYTCIGKTQGGKLISSDIITVQDSNEQWNRVENIAILADTVIGNKVIIFCGDPNVPLKNIVWTKENYVIHPSNPKYRIQPDGSLIIIKVEQSDQAVYSCVRQNADGTHTSNSMTITVDKHKHPPSITIKPARSGNTVILKCGLPGKLLEDALWAKDNLVVNVCNPRYVIQENKTLIINDFQSSDVGRYKCIASYYDRSQSVEEFIVYDDTNLPPDTVYIPANIGQCVTLYCTSDSGSVTWTGGDHKAQGLRRIVNTDGSLLIRQVAPSDAGEYTCTDFLTGKSKSFIIQITNSSLPTIVVDQYKPDVTANLGQTATLNCAVTGNPLPLITWTKDGYPINNMDGRYKLNDDQTLEIRGIQDYDQGIYNCLASNEVGKLNNEISLHVEATASKGPDGRIQLEIGSSGTIKCPLPQGSQIIWFKNGIAINVFDPRFHFFSNQIVIDNIQHSDYGIYRCQGVGFGGMLATKEIEVVVVKGRSDNGVMIGATVNLNCNIDVPPNQVVAWTKDGLPLILDQRISMYPNMSLVIRNFQVSDLGKYVCTGMNFFGNLDTREFNLVTKGDTNNVGQVRHQDRGTSTRLDSVSVGSTVTIMCDITGNPTAPVRWTKDGMELTIFDTRKIHIFANQSLVIENFDHYDYGTYTCSGVNSFGRIETKQFEIVKKEPPQLPPPPPSPPAPSSPTVLPLDLGITVTINCIIPTSNPLKPKTWKKDGFPLNLFDRRMEYDSTHSKIKIRDFQTTDYGLYSCSTIDMYGHPQEIDYRLVPRVFGNLRTSKTVPQPIDVAVLPGATVNLNCPVQTNSSIKWLKGGIPVTTSAALQLTNLNQTMVIYVVTRDALGEYTCVNIDKQETLLKYNLTDACQDEKTQKMNDECVKSEDQQVSHQRKVSHSYTKQHLETENQESYVPVYPGLNSSLVGAGRKPPECEQDVSNLHNINMIWPAETCTEYYECVPEQTSTKEIIYVPKLKLCNYGYNFNPEILKCEPMYKYSCIG